MTGRQPQGVYWQVIINNQEARVTILIRFVPSSGDASRRFSALNGDISTGSCVAGTAVPRAISPFDVDIYRLMGAFKLQ